MKTCSQILYELNQENIKQWELYHKDIKKNRPKSDIEIKLDAIIIFLDQLEERKV